MPTTTHVFDVDADLLRRRADAIAHTASETVRHLEAEYTDEIEVVMATLAPNEPYAYTYPARFLDDGTLQRPIARTRAEVRSAYEALHSGSTVVSMTPLVDIRSDWYTFANCVGGAIVKSTGQPVESDVLVIFPIGRGDGITGELYWSRTLPFGDDPLPGRGAPVVGGKRAALASHDRLLDALRTGDVAAIDSCSVEGVQTSIRDYVDDTGTLASLDGVAEQRAYYERFFDKLDVGAVELLCRVVDDWYAFAELRYRARIKTGPNAGAEATFHTAEFCVFAPDGRVLVRTGHGTDLDLG